MKTFSWKFVSLAIPASLLVLMVVSGSAVAGSPPEGEKKANLNQLKSAINTDVQRVQVQQRKVELLEKQCRDDNAGKANTSAAKNEWLKAKADLQREKNYLAADKQSLLKEHQAIIQQRTKKVRAERAEVMSAKAKLFAALFKVKPSNVSDAQTVVDASHALKQGNTRLKAAKQNRNDDLIAINKEIREVKGQNLLVLGAEDGAAKLQTLALK